MREVESIQDDPEYKASVNRLDEMIREHFKLIEDFGNKIDANEDGTTDTSMVSGWVLVLGTTGWNSESGEFHDGMVEMPASMNTFMAIGLAEYGHGFLRHSMQNYLGGWSHSDE